MGIKEIAEILQIDPKALERDSLRIYLEKRLKFIEVELFQLMQKYGIKNVFEFDEAINKGKLHEDNSFENFFKFDNLEDERDKIVKVLEEL